MGYYCTFQCSKRVILTTSLQIVVLTRNLDLIGKLIYKNWVWTGKSPSSRDLVRPPKAMLIRYASMERT